MLPACLLFSLFLLIFINLFLILWNCFVRLVVQFLEQFIYLFSFVVVLTFLVQLIFKKIWLILFFLIRDVVLTFSVLIKIAFILIIDIVIFCRRWIIKNVQTIWVNLNEIFFVFGLVEFYLFLPVFLFAFLYSFYFVFNQCVDVFELLRGFRFFMVWHFLIMNLLAVWFVFPALLWFKGFTQQRHGFLLIRLIHKVGSLSVIDWIWVAVLTLPLRVW